MVAKTALQTAQQGQRIQFQPYVAVLSSTLRTTSEGPAQVQILFENAGLTPAFNLSCEAYAIVVLGRQVDEVDFPKSGTMSSVAGVAAPHHQGSCFVPVPAPSGKAFVDDLAAKRLTLGARAYLSYSDRFGQQHHVVFTAAAGGKYGLSSDGRMALTGRNSSDE